MREPSNRIFACLLAGLLVIQLLAGLWHIGDPFTDGRIHYNWGPAFWLLNAENINEVGLNSTYWGVYDYPSHPQLIGPVIALWTQATDYSEASIRTLSLVLTIIATLTLTMAMRAFLGNRRALAFAFIFAALPLIYIYGKKLDQEVLVMLFLGAYLWGVALLEQRRKIALALVGVGAFGMMMSDWVGALFVATTAVAGFSVWKDEPRWKTFVPFVLSAFGGAGLGLLVFLVQSYLQSGVASIGEFVRMYYELWYYRSALSDVSVFRWLTQQINFLSSNFFIPAALLGFFGVYKGLRQKWDVVDDRLRIASLFVVAILVGHLVYILALMQASGIHIYYQFYFALPIVFGLTVLLEWLAGSHRKAERKKKEANRFPAWVSMLVALVLFMSGYTVYQYNLLFTNMYGDASDIDLVKSFRTIPTSATLVVVETHPWNAAWFQNPNIEYYAGRTIQAYLVEEGVPSADYMVTRLEVARQILPQINAGAAGPGVSGEALRCSTHFCLLHLTKK